MINFDALPDEAPQGQFTLIPEGKYKALIENAEMRTPRDSSKPDYLNLTWEVFGDNDETLGKVYDMLTESTSPYMQYKLKTFMKALNINLGPRFELRDLCKVCKKKEAKIAITIGKDQNDQDKSQINMFDKAMYAPLTEDEKWMKVPETSEDGVPFDEASDENY